MLEGMRTIIRFAEATVDDFLREEHVESLFDVAKRLADMIHKK